MAGRTVNKWLKVYVSGYDITGYARSAGPLLWEFDEADLTTLGDSVKGYLPNMCQLGLGTLNSVLDSTTDTGMIDALAKPGPRGVMIAVGDRAAPALGNPVYMGYFDQAAFVANEDAGAMTLSLPMDNVYSDGTAFAVPWGVLLHPMGAETSSTDGGTAVGIHNNLAATTDGVIMAYQCTGTDSNSSYILKLQDSPDNVTYSDITGATVTVTERAGGIIETARPLAIGQYVRWCLANVDSSVTFACAYARGRNT